MRLFAFRYHEIKTPIHPIILPPQLRPPLNYLRSVSLVVPSAMPGRHTQVDLVDARILDDLSVLVEVSALGTVDELMILVDVSALGSVDEVVVLVDVSALGIVGELIVLLDVSSLGTLGDPIVLVDVSALSALSTWLILRARIIVIITGTLTGRIRHDNCPTHRATVPHPIHQPLC